MSDFNELDDHLQQLDIINEVGKINYGTNAVNNNMSMTHNNMSMMQAIKDEES